MLFSPPEDGSELEGREMRSQGPSFQASVTGQPLIRPVAATRQKPFEERSWALVLCPFGAAELVRNQLETRQLLLTGGRGETQHLQLEFAITDSVDAPPVCVAGEMHLHSLLHCPWATRCETESQEMHSSSVCH